MDRAYKMWHCYHNLKGVWLGSKVHLFYHQNLKLLYQLQFHIVRTQVILLEPLHHRQSFLVEKILVQGDKGAAFVRLLNPRKKPIRLSQFSIVMACSVDVGGDSVVALVTENAHTTLSSTFTNQGSKGLDAMVETPGRDTGSSKTVEIDLSDTDLTKAQKAELSLLNNYSDCFSSDLSNIGRCNIYEYELPTTGAPSTYQSILSLSTPQS